MPLPPLRALLLALALVAPSAAAAQSPVTNQRLFDTGPFLPDHYAARLAGFRAQPVDSGRTVFLGDSITEGGDWPTLTGDAGVLNRGISGDVTFGVLDRLDEVTARRPGRVFLLIGVNDVGKDIPDAVIADNVRRIVERVRAASPATTVYVQSLLPVNPSVDGFPQHYDKAHHVARTNRLLRDVADRTGAHFVDLYPLFLDRLGRLDAALTGDGLHLNAEGYARWAGHLRALGLF